LFNGFVCEALALSGVKCVTAVGMMMKDRYNFFSV